MPTADLTVNVNANAITPTLLGLILETAVGRKKDVQDIDVHGRFEKLVVTLLVMRAYSNFPGALIACAYFRDPTAVSRFIECPVSIANQCVFLTDV